MKKTKGLAIFVLVLFSIAGLLIIAKFVGVLDNTYLSTDCDPAYNVCFTTNADKSIPNPVNLKDLSYTEIGNLDDKSHDAGTLHYPGSIIKIAENGLNDYRAGIGASPIVLRNSNNGGETFVPNLMQVLCGGIKKFDWRPDRVSWDCTTWSSEYGAVHTEITTYPIDKYSFLVKIVGNCINDEECQIASWSSEPGEVVTIDGYSGFKQTFNAGTPEEFAVYNLYEHTPDVIESNKVIWNNQVDTHGLMIMDINLDKVSDIFTNKETYKEQAHNDITDFYRQFRYPSECEDAWCRERYYRSVQNIMYNTHEAYPGIPSKWGNNTAIIAGARYDGVWIWDSFFNAWMYVNNCVNEQCADIAFDNLRILIENKYPDGQWAREVWYNDKGQDWQAPGGWSFAVDQMDKRFGGSAYSLEFYQHLKDYHEWIATNKDRDNDGIFEWSWANSGWDGSVRWNNAQGEEALDLNAWMILDAEALGNMATRLGLTNEADDWNQRKLAYIASYQNLCDDSDLCYDQNIYGTPSTVITPAMYFSMLAGAITPDKASLLVNEMNNPETLGGYDSSGLGILPTIARNDPGFCPCGAGCPVWSGQQWINVNGIAYLGMLRYGMDTEADLLRDKTLLTTAIGGMGYESYCSATEGNRLVGHKSSNFGGQTFVWTDAFDMLLKVPIIFDYEPLAVVEPTPTVTPSPTPTPSTDFNAGDIVFYTDTHVNDGDTGPRFQLLVNWINTKSFVYGFALGDNIDDRNKPEQLLIYNNIDNQLNLDHSILVGNHDDPTYQPWSKNNMVLLRGGSSCIAMFNTYSTYELHGYWTTAQTNWLQDEMVNNEGVCDYFVILSHHGIYDAYFDRSSGNQAIAKTIIDNNKDRYLKVVHYRGHNHNFVVDVSNGVEYITVPKAGSAITDINPASVVYNTETAEDELCYLVGGCTLIGSGITPTPTPTVTPTPEPTSTPTPSCISTIEVCDGIDNDCDDLVDEGVINVCTDYNFCTVYTTCSVCETEPTELCDDIDNNCDGTTDEDCDCVTGDTEQCGISDKGTCKFGIQTCEDGQWSTCVGNINPVKEDCDDNLDNDCDGLVNDGCGEPPPDNYTKEIIIGTVAVTALIAFMIKILPLLI